MRNPFHPEPRFPAGVRSEFADYRGSGCDGSHVAPNGEMSDARSRRELFSLANMIPQDHDDNAHLWAAIEGAVRGRPRLTARCTWSRARCSKARTWR